MDWKQEAIEKLRGYAAQRQALESIPQQLAHLEGAYTGIRSAKLDGMPVAGGSNTREDAMLSNIARRDDLRRKLIMAELWVGIVNGGLSVLDDKERLTLELCFIHTVKGSIDDLCYRLNVEKSAAYRRRDSALRHFTQALYGPLPGL